MGGEFLAIGKGSKSSRTFLDADGVVLEEETER